MKRAEIQVAVNAEIATFRNSIVPLKPGEVQVLYAAEICKYGDGRTAFQGLRTEVNAALQLRNPPPHTHDPEDSSGALTHEERDALHTRSRSEVSDAHRVLSDHARQLDPNHTDAHHFVQKLHGMALWQETDRAIAEAGITPILEGAS